MSDPKKIDEIIVKIIAETFAKIKYPNATSITTSMERKLSINNSGELEPVLYVKTIVQKASEKAIVDIKITPTSNL